MIFNLKDIDLNNYVSWVYSTLLGTLQGYENNGQLGSPKIVTVTGEDINNYITAGIYCFAVNNTPINKPEGNTNGWLIVIPWQASGGTCKQIWLRHGTLGSTDYSIYVRTRISGEWGSWSEVITDKSQLVYRLGVALESIPEGSDLNNYKTIGTYYCTGTSVATTIANSPTTFNYKLVVESITAAFIHQTVIARDGKRWYRCYTISTNTWGTWVCGSLHNIKDITMNSNGQLIVTRADGTVATYNPDTLI